MSKNVKPVEEEDDDEDDDDEDFEGNRLHSLPISMQCNHDWVVF